MYGNCVRIIVDVCGGRIMSKVVGLGV
eukprot:SAG25_NODE_11279_length_308_cov_1.205742_2_plen_26_part_01